MEKNNKKVIAMLGLNCTLLEKICICQKQVVYPNIYFRSVLGRIQYSDTLLEKMDQHLCHAADLAASKVLVSWSSQELFSISGASAI